MSRIIFIPAPRRFDLMSLPGPRQPPPRLVMAWRRDPATGRPVCTWRIEPAAPRRPMAEPAAARPARP